MVEQEKVLDAIYGAFDEVNVTLPPDRHFQKSPDTTLLDTNGQVDSLALTILIVAIERKIEEAFGEVIVLVDEQAMSVESSPFLRVESLTNHISGLLEERINESKA